MEAHRQNQKSERLFLPSLLYTHKEFVLVMEASGAHIVKSDNKKIKKCIDSTLLKQVNISQKSNRVTVYILCTDVLYTNSVREL